MPPLREARPGDALRVKGRLVDFSYWPMKRSTRRYGLQSRVFATDPWAIIRQSINEQCTAESREQAQAFCAQAEDYFRAADVAGLFTTQPILLYYSFLNLEKAFALTRGVRPLYARAAHGLAEAVPEGGDELADSFLTGFKQRNSPTAKQNVFNDFLKALEFPSLGSKKLFEMSALLPQILQGHRLWCG